MYLTTIEEVLLDAFNSIFLENKKTNEFSVKKIKLYLFIYLFGCIKQEHLTYISQDEEEMSKKNIVEQKNACRSRVNYWVKEGELKCESKEVYILTAKGLKVVYSYIQQEYNYAQFEFDKFRSNYNPPSKNYQHASNTGISVLSLIEFGEMTFWINPLLDSGENRIKGEFRKIQERMIIPDALIQSSICERIYVETDNSTEKKTTSLLPKLYNYSNMFFANEQDIFHKTIHFTVWHKSANNDIGSPYYGIYDIEQLHKFTEKILNKRISYRTFTYIMKKKRLNDVDIPSVQAAITLLEKANVYKYEGFESENILKKCVDFNLIYSPFDQEFYIREQYIYKAAEECYPLCCQLLKGARLVCVPVYSSYRLLNCVYLEYINPDYLFNFIKKRGFKFTRTQKFYEKSYYVEEPYVFKDIKNNEKFIFKHVFRLYDEEKRRTYYVAMENVSEDYGGRIRVRNYIRNKIEIEEELYILCLYNMKSTPKPYQIYKYEESRYQERNISFVSYDEFMDSIAEYEINREQKLQMSKEDICSFFAL